MKPSFGKVRHSISAERPSPSWDQLLARANHICQILLVLLAIFGYFYTVRPAFSKALLEEQIAKKELELDRLEKDLQENRNQITRATAELGSAKSELSRKTEELALATSRLVDIQKTVTEARAQVDQARTQQQQTAAEAQAFSAATFDGTLGTLATRIRDNCRPVRYETVSYRLVQSNEKLQNSGDKVAMTVSSPSFESPIKLSFFNVKRCISQQLVSVKTIDALPLEMRASIRVQANAMGLKLEKTYSNKLNATEQLISTNLGNLLSNERYIVPKDSSYKPLRDYLNDFVDQITVEFDLAVVDLLKTRKIVHN